MQGSAQRFTKIRIIFCKQAGERAEEQAGGGAARERRKVKVVRRGEMGESWMVGCKVLYGNGLGGFFGLAGAAEP